MGTAVVSDTTDDAWCLNESVSEQFGVGVKAEAAQAEQTSEGGRKAGDAAVCCGGVSCGRRLSNSGLGTRPPLSLSLFNVLLYLLLRFTLS